MADPPPEAPMPQGSSDKPAGEAIDAGRGRVFPCEQCGADLEFHIGQQRLKCPFCGYEKDIDVPEGSEVREQDFRETLARMRELHEQNRDDADEQDRMEIRCDSCGGVLVFVGPLTSSECPYCAAPIQRENVHVSKQRISVDGVLPFLVPRETAEVNLKAWVASRWFAPDEFREKGAEGKFQGVYLPFWTYDTLTATRYSGERGEHYWVTVGTGKEQRRERRTRWYSADGSFQRFFDDVLVLAAKGIRADLMLELEPWPLGESHPFQQQYLAGYLARTYEVSLEDGFEDARQRIDAAISTEVRSRIGGDEQRVHSIKSNYGAIKFKHLLLPAWLMAYRHRDTPYQVMINAATGEVQGERPYSWIKILLAVLVALLVAGAFAGLAGLMNR